MATTPADLGALFAPGGAGTLAIEAAFNAAFGAGGVATLAINAALASISARVDNARLFRQNRSTFQAIIVQDVAKCVLVRILKVFEYGSFIILNVTRPSSSNTWIYFN